MNQGENIEVMYKLGRIESLAQAMNDKLDTHIKDSEEIHHDHEERISSLERKSAASSARVGLVSGGLGAISGLIVPTLLKFIGIHSG